MNEEKEHPVLQKLAETLEEHPEPSQPAKPAPVPVQDSDSVQHRKHALIEYLAALFLLACLVVLLSLISQHKTLAKVHINANSALERAAALQDENVTLKSEKSDLEKALKEAEDQKQEDDKTIQAGELLSQALFAKLNGDADAFHAAMEALEPLEKSLNETSYAIYIQLR